MSCLIDKVRDHANASHWCTAPYKGFVAGTPTSTFNELVSMAFNDVTQNFHHAKHARYDQMYTPYLGSFRESPIYSSLAPSLCIPRRNRTCTYIYTPNNAYNPRQGEWLTERGKPRQVKTPKKRGGSAPVRATSEPPLAPIYRRTYTVPTSTTRVDNYGLYWGGRVSGVDYIAPFLQDKPYSITEDRRYQRIFWSPEFINLTPSCRHATHFMLSAY